MFELKNSFIYKACKKIKTINIEAENLDLLKYIANSIDLSFFYFYDAYRKVIKITTYIPKV